MSRKRNHFILALLVISQVSFASLWSSLKFWEPDQVDTLIVTGNYLDSRALAELVQLEEELPIILVSKDAFPDKFYYLPLPNEKTTTVHKMSRFKDILTFINPKSVIIIGDDRYVDKEIVNTISVKGIDGIPTLHVKSDNWAANAKSLAKHFDNDDLVEKYRKIINLAHNRTGDEFATESVEPIDEKQTPVAEDELTNEALISDKEEVAIEEPEAETIELKKSEEAKKAEKEVVDVKEDVKEVIQLEPEVIAVEDDEEIKKEAIEKIK